MFYRFLTYKFYEMISLHFIIICLFSLYALTYGLELGWNVFNSNVWIESVKGGRFGGALVCWHENY